jgi:hypothetical protein
MYINTYTELPPFALRQLLLYNIILIIIIILGQLCPFMGAVKSALLGELWDASQGYNQYQRTRPKPRS